MLHVLIGKATTWECGNHKGVARTEHVTAIYIDACAHKAAVLTLCRLRLYVAETKDRRMAPIISRTQAWIQILCLLHWIRYSLVCKKNSVLRKSYVMGQFEWMSCCFKTYMTLVLRFHIAWLRTVMFILRCFIMNKHVREWLALLILIRAEFFVIFLIPSM